MKRERDGGKREASVRKFLRRLTEEFNRQQDGYYQLQLTENFQKMLEKRAVEFHLEEDVQGKNGKDNKRRKKVG